MTTFQFWFLVALICSVAQALYEEHVRMLDGPKWIKRGAVFLVIAFNLAIATGVGWIFALLLRGA